MDFNIEEFKGYLRIDRDNLDEEIMRQASLFYEVAEAGVQAKADADTLKEEISNIDAELFAKHKLRQAKDGKATEASVKAAVQADPKHQKAHQRYINAKELTDKLVSLQEAFRQRGQMLRELAGLHVSNYFQKDSVSLNDIKNVKYVNQRERINSVREGRRRERL